MNSRTRFIVLLDEIKQPAYRWNSFVRKRQLYNKTSYRSGSTSLFSTKKQVSFLQPRQRHTV